MVMDILGPSRHASRSTSPMCEMPRARNSGRRGDLVVGQRARVPVEDPGEGDIIAVRPQVLSVVHLALGTMSAVPLRSLLWRR